MATRMQVVRHLPNDTASRKIGFTLTDEQANEVTAWLKTVDTVKPYFFKFTDAKLVTHYYQLDRIIYVNFESNWVAPVKPDEKTEQEGE